MRFLGIGDYCDLASMYLRLQAEGHEVRVFISEPLCQGTLAGLAPRVDDWESQLPWIREAGRDGYIIFENVAEERGTRQDELRAAGFQVIGGCSFGDRLENDRGYAQRLLHDLGFPVAQMFGFDRLADAERFLERNPGRYVLKFNGDTFGAADNYVGRAADGRDVIAMLRAKFRQLDRERISFVLMEYVDGVETGVGAYFNGRRFLRPACLDWEHKAFFPGDLGELTGEMGTVVTYQNTDRFFEKTLARMAPLLAQHGYCGYINLNTIVNEGGIWPLEFTSRFGYPGYAILEPLQRTSWSKLFKSLTQHDEGVLETSDGFCVGVVMTTRPFPYVRTFVPEPVGLPIIIEGELSREDRDNIHLGEVGLEGDQLVTAGYHGWSMVVTGVGANIREAQAAAYNRARRVIIPNLRYRIDIGQKLIDHDFEWLTRMGYMGDTNL
jgi:phosphoribosylamine--glycine ligase